MTSEKGPSSCQVVRVLQPFAQLMHTSLKKAQILIQSEDEDAWRRDITEVNPDFVLQSSLNDYLIYFIAEKKVVETMEDSASQQLGKKSLKEWGRSKKSWSPSWRSLRGFGMRKRRSSLRLKAVLSSRKFLHVPETYIYRRFEELDEPEISNLLQMTSILGLSDVVADSLKGIDP